MEEGDGKCPSVAHLLATITKEFNAFPSTCRAAEEAVDAAVEAAVRVMVLVPATVLARLFKSMVKWKVRRAMYLGSDTGNQPTYKSLDGDLGLVPETQLLRRHKYLRPPLIWVYIGSRAFIGHGTTLLGTGTTRQEVATLARRVWLDTGVRYPMPPTLSHFMGSPLWRYAMNIAAAMSLQLAMTFNACHIHFKHGLTSARELFASHLKLCTLEESVHLASESTQPLPMGLSKATALELRPRIVRNKKPKQGTYVPRATYLHAQATAEANTERWARHVLGLAQAFIRGGPMDTSPPGDLQDDPPLPPGVVPGTPEYIAHRLMQDTTPEAATLVAHTDMEAWAPADAGVPRYTYDPGSLFPTTLRVAVWRFNTARSLGEASTTTTRKYIHRGKDLLLKAYRQTETEPCSISNNNTIRTLHAHRAPGEPWPLPGAFYGAIMGAMRSIINGTTALPPGLGKHLDLHSLSVRDTTLALTTTNTLQAISIKGLGFTLRLGLPSATAPTKSLAVHSSFSRGKSLMPTAATFMAVVLATAGFPDATITMPTTTSRTTGQATMTLPFTVDDSAPVFRMGANPGVARALRIMANYCPDDRGRCRGMPPWMQLKPQAAKINSGIRYDVLVGTRTISVAIHKSSLVMTGRSDAQDFTVAALAVCLQLYRLSDTPMAIGCLPGCSRQFAADSIHRLLTSPREDLPMFDTGNACLNWREAPPGALRIMPNGRDPVMVCIDKAVQLSNIDPTLVPKDDFEFVGCT